MNTFTSFHTIYLCSIPKRLSTIQSRTIVDTHPTRDISILAAVIFDQCIHYCTIISPCTHNTQVIIISGVSIGGRGKLPPPHFVTISRKFRELINYEKVINICQHE